MAKSDVTKGGVDLVAERSCRFSVVPVGLGLIPLLVPGIPVPGCPHPAAERLERRLALRLRSKSQGGFSKVPIKVLVVVRTRQPELQQL